MSSSRRLLRVRELLKREIGEAIRRELPAEKVGLITVNEIQVSPDMHNARVFVGILGSEAQRKKAIKELMRSRIRIQNSVGFSVALKHTPKLNFLMDDSASESTRVLQIIEQLDLENPVEDSEDYSEE